MACENEASFVKIPVNTFQIIGAYSSTVSHHLFERLRVRKNRLNAS